MDRRAFLGASLFLFAGVWFLKGRPALPETTFRSVLFDNLEHVKALGSAFRRSHPQAPGAQVSPARLSDLLRTHSASIEEDFERGHLVVINGWLVSHTEARICASV